MFTKIQANKYTRRSTISVLLIVVSSVTLTACSGIPSLLSFGAEKYDFTDALKARDDSGQAPAHLDVIPITQHQIAIERTRRSEAKQRLQLPPDRVISPYLVGSGDELAVTVWNNSEFNSGRGDGTNVTQLRVGTDGKIFFPHVGSVTVAGLTSQEIRQELVKQLSVRFKDPQLDVVVTQYNSKNAFVVGEVQSPGEQAITQRPLTVMESIRNADGLTEDADLEHATLIRQNTVYAIDLNDLFTHGQISRNYVLLNEDVLKIPSIRANGIYVVGEVESSARQIMKGGIFSLSEALKSAGKITPLTGKVPQYFIIRRTQGAPKIFHLPSDAMETSILADSFNLVAQDIVYVVTADKWDGHEIYEQITQFLEEYSEAY